MTDWPYDEEASEPVPRQPRWTCGHTSCTCEPASASEPLEHAVLIHDLDGSRLPGARCRVVANGKIINTETPSADEEGWLHITLEQPLDSVLLEWAPATRPLGDSYPHRARYHFGLELPPNEASKLRLLHLGFCGGVNLADEYAPFSATTDTHPRASWPTSKTCSSRTTTAACCPWWLLMRRHPQSPSRRLRPLRRRHHTDMLSTGADEARPERTWSPASYASWASTAIPRVPRPVS